MVLMNARLTKTVSEDINTVLLIQNIAYKKRDHFTLATAFATYED